MLDFVTYYVVVGFVILGLTALLNPPALNKVYQEHGLLFFLQTCVVITVFYPFLIFKVLYEQKY